MDPLVPVLAQPLSGHASLGRAPGVSELQLVPTSQSCLLGPERKRSHSRPLPKQESSLSSGRSVYMGRGTQDVPSYTSAPQILPRVPVSTANQR